MICLFNDDNVEVSNIYYLWLQRPINKTETEI